MAYVNEDEGPEPVAELIGRIHKPCVFHPAGADKGRCQEISGKPIQNNRCAGSNCASPWRMCAACIVQVGQRAAVSNPKTGLCDFHEKNGREAVRKAPSASATEARLDLMKEVGKKMRPAAGPSTPPKTEPKAPSPEELENFTKKYMDLSFRQREVVERAFVEGDAGAARNLNLTEGSINAIISTVCTQIGIPPTNVKGSRRIVLRSVAARAAELFAQKGGPDAPTPHEVKRVVRLFRGLSEEHQRLALQALGLTKVSE